MSRDQLSIRKCHYADWSIWFLLSLIKTKS